MYKFNKAGGGGGGFKVGGPRSSPEESAFVTGKTSVVWRPRNHETRPPFLSNSNRAVTWYWRIRRSGSTTSTRWSIGRQTGWVVCYEIHQWLLWASFSLECCRVF